MNASYRQLQLMTGKQMSVLKEPLAILCAALSVTLDIDAVSAV